ncbi:hypothetical protein [uncultured Paenibacillus sp.]|uniref:hypothetical protein n=1 Tax=uncultured Paenibacillus sp. TaxID=227322 RepID=UPI0028D2BFB5|nr:hypothetical protein [uncultured Paenibacillus sp.]
MIQIRTMKDLHLLAEARLPEPLIAYARELLAGLQAEAGEDDSDDFLLLSPVFVCEAGDKLLDRFRAVPYGPEYVELVDISSFRLYRVGILLDNDWIAQYLVPVHSQDQVTEAWLREQSGGAVKERE